MQTGAELILGHDPDTVPRARRFVRSLLEGEPAQLVATAELVVSELVTNAMLHAEPPIIVRLLLHGDARIEVEDAGRGVPILVGQSDDAMTGRGLSMVDAVASGWGVEPIGDGRKVVWAELSRDGSARSPGSHPQIDIDSLLQAWAKSDRYATTYRVHLGAVSTELLLAAKAHIDNVVRELVLLREGEASRGVALPPEMAALVDTVTFDFAEARAEIKRQAAAAGARGDTTTTLVLNLPASAADAAERYLAALDQADRYARSSHLLTLATPPEHRLFRRWYVHSLVDQLRALSRGEEPPAPQSFEVVLAQEVARLSEVEQVSARLELLRTVAGELGTARSPEEMAQVVVDNAIDFLGVDSALVRILTAEDLLRTVAARGPTYSGLPLPEVDLSLDADSPVAEVARTGRPYRSRAQAHALGPERELAGQFQAGRTVHIVPLLSGGNTLGILRLGFVDGELSEDAEDALSESLADTLARALNWTRLSITATEKQNMLSFLAEATQIMVTASEPSEVLERLAQHAVPHLADWCTVYLADAGTLRRTAMAIDGHPDLAGDLKDTPPIPLELDIPHTRAFRRGKLELIPHGVGTLLHSLYPDLRFDALGGDADRASGLCAPIEIRGKRIGVIALTFLASGRQVTPNLVEASVGLAARAAIALDNAERWSAQHQAVQALVNSLLPPPPPDIPGFTFAARYLPAGGDVAGDWWEADLMPDGTILVGLGDAAGHGLDAVTQMCELRHGARALAAVESSPAALLTDLNRRLSGPDAGFATAVYGRLDPATGELRWASAGHLPPLLLHRDGRVTVLRPHGKAAALGTPVAGASVDQKLVLLPGDTLLLYSDGVIERRDENLDNGLARLVQTVDRHRDAPPDDLANRIIYELCARPLDDCCLLLVHRNVTG